MGTEYLGYDATRLGDLGRRVVGAVEHLDAIRCGDPAAALAMTTVREIGARLSTEWLPTLCAIAGDTTLLGWTSRRQSGPLVPIDTPSDADRALGAIAERLEVLDTDHDGELSWPEIVTGGAFGDDPELAAACAYLVDHPLVFANTALAEADYSIGDLDDLDDLGIDNIEDGGWEVDMSDPDSDAPMWQSMTLTPAALAGAVEQRRHLRTLSEPAVFAAADGADDGGRIDGRVSPGDLEALMGRTADPAVAAMCAYFLARPDAFKRIDRESPDTDFNGTIAYDQVYELATNQGALAGLPGPEGSDQGR